VPHDCGGERSEAASAKMALFLEDRLDYEAATPSGIFKQDQRGCAALGSQPVGSRPSSALVSSTGAAQYGSKRLDPNVAQRLVLFVSFDS
jgi:hypothetical protein